MNSGWTSPAGWAERYETLRRYVLEGRRLFQTQPLGLALWVTKGMAGWMGQWGQVSELRVPAVQRAAPLREVTTGAWQEQLTLLLAQMTLEQLEPPSLI